MTIANHAQEESLRRIVLRRVLRWARREAGSPAFRRLLILQVCGAGGDGLVALALAGSLFFSVPETAARSRVLLYLLVTAAPLAVVAPILSGVLDRHRAGLLLALAVSVVGRSACAWMLAPRLGTLYLFPLSFGILVLSRAAQVARGAILPAVAPGDRSLVAANSSVAKAGALAGVVFVPVGWGVIKTLGSAAEVRLAALLYLIGVIPALRLPAGRGARTRHLRKEARAGRRPTAVRQAMFATAGTRFVSGFLVFHLAFAVRREDLGTIGLGAVIAAAALGTLLGGVLAGRTGRTLREEAIVTVALAAASAAGIAVGLLFTLPLAIALLFALGIASAWSKIALDSLVQRDVGEVTRGWVFARFEAGLQLSWVVGALLPVAFALPADVGVILAGTACALFALTYHLGRMRRTVHRTR
jgi:hypothetical protein